MKGNFLTILCSLIAYAAALHMAIYGPPERWGWNGSVVRVLYNVLGRNGYVILFALIGTILIIRMFIGREDKKKT